MKLKMWVVQMLLASSLLAQSANVYIYDSNGNQASGTIINGSLYFHDSKGNTTVGNIRDGNVFLSASTGETTIGTIKNGNVFLSNQNGTIVGTISNGNVFLANSDGSATIGTYDASGRAYTSTNGVSTTTTVQSGEPQRTPQQDYDDGAAFGRAVGSVIAGGVENHRINSFCKANPTSTYHSDDGISTPCPDASLDSWEQQQVSNYCSDHPGSWTAFGKRRVDCVTPPNPVTLQWAQWEMKAWQWDYRHPSRREVIALSLSVGQLLSNWEYWKKAFCGLEGAGATFKDLEDKKQHCD